MTTLQRWIWIVWPAFFSACLTEALVFALVDPDRLHWFGQPIGLSRLGVYSAAFFAFWLIGMIATGLTVLLAWPESLSAAVTGKAPDRPAAATPLRR